MSIVGKPACPPTRISTLWHKAKRDISKANRTSRHCEPGVCRHTCSNSCFWQPRVFGSSGRKSSIRADPTGCLSEGVRESGWVSRNRGAMPTLAWACFCTDSACPRFSWAWHPAARHESSPLARYILPPTPPDVLGTPAFTPCKLSAGALHLISVIIHETCYQWQHGAADNRD